MTDIILIRSIDRTSSSTNSSNFQINLTDKVEGLYEVLYVVMYNSFYNVVANVNDTIYFNENSTNKSCTISPGYYSTSGSNSILTALASAMTTASGGYNTYTATIGAANQLITVAAGNNFSFTFGTNTSRSLAQTLGFTNTNTTAATSSTAVNLPNLGGINSVAIYIPQSTATNFECSSGSFGNVLVPMDVAFENRKFYIEYDFKQKVLFAKNCQTINIILRDTSGNNVSLNNTEWEMAIRKCKREY